jgi:hypothetical protein
MYGVDILAQLPHASTAMCCRIHVTAACKVNMRIAFRGTAEAYQKVALPKLKQRSCYVCLFFAQNASILSQHVLQVLLQVTQRQEMQNEEIGQYGDCNSAFISSSSVHHCIAQCDEFQRASTRQATAVC